VLTLWRRHKATCPHRADRYYRKCRCAVHVEGTVEGKYIRQSLKTRSWERGDTLRFSCGFAPFTINVSASVTLSLVISRALVAFSASR